MDKYSKKNKMKNTFRRSSLSSFNYLNEENGISNFLVSKIKFDESKKIKSINNIKQAKANLDEINYIFSQVSQPQKKNNKNVKKRSLVIYKKAKEVREGKEEIGFVNNLNLNIKNFPELLGTLKDYENFDLGKKKINLNYNRDDAELMVNILDRMKMKKVLKKSSNYQENFNTIINEKRDDKYEDNLPKLQEKNTSKIPLLKLKKYNNLENNESSGQSILNKIENYSTEPNVSNYDTKNRSNVLKLKKLNISTKSSINDVILTSPTMRATHSLQVENPLDAFTTLKSFYPNEFSSMRQSNQTPKDTKGWLNIYNSYRKDNFKDIESVKFSPSKESKKINIKNLQLISKNIYLQKFDKKGNSNIAKTRNIKFSHSDNSNNKYSLKGISHKSLNQKSAKSSANKEFTGKAKSEKFLKEIYKVLNLEEFRAKLIMKKSM